eukprot:CAMPEP_0179449188 /NCGR_PEP_ID=MMETSP0799-20121207/33171_1 /TAXON_ID=46947 /ORGANISM="Geminigera cryophila, Strain CCMP2564" /LENGTH=359 /DNA_ID=CAMNT_0021242055 /DNA_START=81 /DNA_END=1160 /DNA_ORIENTATION=+
MGSHARLPNIDISAVLLPGELRAKLVKGGFKMTADFSGMSPSELAKETQMSQKDAVEVLRAIRGDARPAQKGGKSALELLQENKDAGPKHVITFCADMDNMLGGGVAMGEVTEFCGAPGIGKTQLGIQLAVDVHLPGAFGGAQGEAVYIDTEGSFMEERAKDIASAFVGHVHKMGAQTERNERDEHTSNLSVESILSSIYVYRVHDYVEQIAVVACLDKFLDAHPLVKLVVMDSVAFQFRTDFKDYAMRSRLLTASAQRLTQLAIERKIAVVLINQVTTKIEKGPSSSSFLAPALGETWAHACTSRVMLYWEHGQRFARLYKSPSRKTDTVAYSVLQEGIRGVNKKRRSKQSSQARALG